MKVVATNRQDNTLYIRWEDGREQTLEIVGFWDLFHLGWSVLSRRLPRLKHASFDQPKL